MSNHQRGFIATNIILLILAGLVLLGGVTVGVITLVQKDTVEQCEGGICPTATSTITFPEADWAPRAPDVCGDTVCGPDESANPTLCPADCEVKEAPTGPSPMITFTAKPASLPSTGGTSVLTWSSQNATSCASSASPGSNSTWFFAGAPSGTVNVSPGSLGKTYTITCSGPGGSAQKSVTVAVAKAEKKKVVYTPTYKAPTITLSPTSAKISYGKTALFSWKTAYATSCTGSGPWSDTTFGTTDTKYTTSLLESAIVELTCIGQGGSVTKKASVTVADAKSCYLGISSVANGSSATAYQASSVSYGNSCVSETRTCTNGSLSGSYLYTSCTVADASSCVTPWYATLKDGEMVTAYSASSVGYGETCASETRTCSNGTLSGSYTKSSCEASDAADCYLSSLGTIPHDSSITAYSASSVDYGASCSSETRSCADGVLSGSYTNLSCTVGEASGCPTPSAWNGCKNSGDSCTGYSASAAPLGSTCSAVSKPFTCSDGSLSSTDSGTYSYGTCTENTTSVPTVTLATPTVTGQTTATLTATINPNNADTEYAWYISTSRPYPSTSIRIGEISATASATDVLHSVTRLSANTNYYVKITATNSKGTTPKEASFTTDAYASCTTPTGWSPSSISHGESITPVYQAATVSYGTTCVSETRTCDDGTLLGLGYTYQNCSPKSAVSCTPGSHGKGYSCTLTQTSSGGYKVECKTTSENKGECGASSSGQSWLGLTGSQQCSTWLDEYKTYTDVGGIGWKVSYADGEYVLTTVGKQNNHSSPRWTYRTCTVLF